MQGDEPIIRVPQEAGPRLEAGTYEMFVTKVRTDHIPSQFNPEGQDVIKFTLALADNPAIEVEAMANDVLFPGSKLTKWLNALGVGVTPGEPLNLQGAKGRKCLANVILNDRGDKGVFSKVDSILPPIRVQNARRESLVPVEADEPPEGHYHPAANAGEPIQDARLVSEKQLEHLSHLLSDVGLDYTALALEQNLPDVPSMMRTNDLARAVDYLNSKKAATPA